MDPEQQRQLQEQLDGLRTARGIKNGVVFGFGIWCVIGVLIWLCW